jgi:hypothetical protein
VWSCAVLGVIDHDARSEWLAEVDRLVRGHEPAPEGLEAPPVDDRDRDDDAVFPFDDCRASSLLPVAVQRVERVELVLVSVPAAERLFPDRVARRSLVTDLRERAVTVVQELVSWGELGGVVGEVKSIRGWGGPGDVDALFGQPGRICVDAL